MTLKDEPVKLIMTRNSLKSEQAAVKLFLNISIISVFILSFNSCSTSRFFYMNKEYYKKPQQKSLHIFPVTSLVFHDSTKAFTRFILQKNPEKIENQVLKVFNEEYQRLSKKHLNEKMAKLTADTASSLHNDFDTTPYKAYKLYDKKKTSFIEISFPSKSNLQEKNINTSYGFHIVDVTLLPSRFYSAMVVPLPGAVVGGSSSGPALCIKGTYILWDYEKDTAICTGTFYKNELSGHLYYDDYLKKFLYPIIVRIFNSTKFWRFNNIYKEK